MNKMNKKGFTLIEMLVVIAIIAVLVSIIVPVVGNSTTKAKAAADAANLRSFAATVAIDYMDDNTITYANYDAPDCKSTTSGMTLTVYMVNDQINAYFSNGSKLFGVDYYATIAQTGEAKDSDGKAIDGIAVPTGAKQLFPEVKE